MFTEDHMHVLLCLPATIPLAKAVQLLKGTSSHWMNETVKSGFAWQEGYGASTIGISQKPGTVAYIQAQREHHHKRNLQQESSRRS